MSINGNKQQSHRIIQEPCLQQIPTIVDFKSGPGGIFAQGTKLITENVPGTFQVESENVRSNLITFTPQLFNKTQNKNTSNTYSNMPQINNNPNLQHQNTFNKFGSSHTQSNQVQPSFNFSNNNVNSNIPMISYGSFGSGNLFQNSSNTNSVQINPIGFLNNNQANNSVFYPSNYI